MKNNPNRISVIYNSLFLEMRKGKKSEAATIAAVNQKYLAVITPSLKTLSDVKTKTVESTAKKTIKKTKCARDFI